MFATELLVEPEDKIEDPTWEQIESALLRLDGLKVTFVGLRGDRPDVHMGVGGGADGKYVVYATYDNLRFHTLLNPEASAGTVSMITGRQRGEFEAEKCVSREAMLLAVRTFATLSERDKSLKWSRR